MREVVTAFASPAPQAICLPVEAAHSAQAPQPAAIRQIGAEVRPVELPRHPATLPMRAEPLSADARRLHVTVSKRFLEKLEVARSALSHSHPAVDAERILEAGLDLLIERAAKRKGIVSHPRQGSAKRAPASPRSISAAVKREVWVRDEGKCQWPTANGGICGSTHRLQFDHIVPVARGGESTAENLRLACALHNDLAARQAFGDDWMDKFTPRHQGLSGRNRGAS